MKLTKLQTACRDAVETWCATHKIALVSRPRHLYPRCYVVARYGQNLVIALPWADAEPHLIDLRSKLQTSSGDFASVWQFDESLQIGSWCTSAYVCTKSWQQPVAIPLVANH